MVAAELTPGNLALGPLALMNGDYKDHGVVIIEQVETWKPEIVKTLRDVIENGSVGRAIRGIVYSGIRTRCSLVVTANWKFGIYRPNMSFIDNLPDVLKDQVDLSRFDVLITTILPSNVETHIKIIEHKLSTSGFRLIKHSDLKELIKYVRQIVPKVEISRKTIEDIVYLQKQGKSLVVVHGGGNLVSEWLTKQGISARFFHYQWF